MENQTLNEIGNCCRCSSEGNGLNSSLSHLSSDSGHIDCFFFVLNLVRVHSHQGIVTAIPTDSFDAFNDWLKLLCTDWFENLSDKFTLKQIVKMIVQSEKSCFSLTGFKTYFEH